MTDYEGVADHFDKEHIPPDMQGQQQIRDYLNDRFRDDTVPPDLKDEIARQVSEKRIDMDIPDTDLSGGQYYYDPDSGAFKDSDTGQFVSKDGPE